MPAPTQPDPDVARDGRLDAIDRRLIDLLVKDGRASTAALAAHIGLSADATRDRVRRLIDNDVVVIQGAINPGTVGLRMSALVGIRVHGPVDPIADRLAEVEFVDFVACTTGSFDLLIELVTPDRATVYRVLEQHVRTIDAVTSTEVFLYLAVEKWTTNSAPHTAVQTKDLDDDDRRIIEALRGDGRMPYRDLATHTGINYSTARRKAIALIESGVIDITTIVNRVATGERVSAAVGVCVHGPLDDILKRLANIDDVLIVTSCAGRFDLFLDIESTSDDAMRTLLYDTIRQIPGIVSTETFHYMRLAKVPFSWMLPSGR